MTSLLQQEQQDLFKKNDYHNRYYDCSYCGNQIIIRGIILYVEAKKTYLFFDSLQCQYHFQKAENRRHKMISNSKERSKTCETCNKNFDPKYKDSLRKYCCRACFNKGKKTTQLLTVNCANCNKELKRWRSSLNRKPNHIDGEKSYHFCYCSMTCQNKHRPPRYLRNFFCDFCCKWIPKSKAVKSQKAKKLFLTCPNIDCNGNRLKIKSKVYKIESERIRID